ncbi:MAG TPA: DNA polymerase IV [Anaerolineaceae bacterium]|nr:DNA polymerase IV [Anaerolineaceae bacterium]
MPRKILHLDLDAFYCSVEELSEPSLKGRPFVVGGPPNQRGVVSSASYAARKFGIRSAMPTANALRRCPELIILRGRRGSYHQASVQVMERLGNLTPLVEQLSIDEAFLDVSDLPTPGKAIAQNLQASIRDELGLPCSIGVATNKLIAKTATDVGKASHRGDGPPNAILEVPPGQEAAFLAPLPVEALWGVGPKTAEHLNQLGAHTIGEILKIPEAQLTQHFGKLGQDLALRARGIDDRPVSTERESKSISQEITFDRDVVMGEELQRTLKRLSEGVGFRLRQESLCGTTVKIKLRWPDFTTISRQVTLPQGTDQDGVIFSAALELFRAAWHAGLPVRLLGVGVSGLHPQLRQLSLWDSSIEKEHRLLEALDELRRRYGDGAIQRGLYGKDPFEES